MVQLHPRQVEGRDEGAGGGVEGRQKNECLPCTLAPHPLHPSHGTEVLRQARLTLNQRGEGSTPSGPTRDASRADL
jgi:hypothetical protein